MIDPVVETAFIPGTFFIAIATLACEHPLYEFPCVLSSICADIVSLSMELSILKFAFIDIPLFICEFSFAVVFICKKIALVLGAK